MGFFKELFGGRTGREKRLDSNFETQNTALVDLLKQNSAHLLGEGDKTLSDFRSQIAIPENFWGMIAGGDKQAMTSALAPELNMVDTAYQNNANANAEFSPRGGGEVAQNTSLQTKKMSSIGDIILGLRPMAADRLTGIAQLLGGVASNLYSAGTGSASSAASANIGGYQQLRLQDQYINDRVGEQLQGIGQLLAFI